jgi:hypothetical protein
MERAVLNPIDIVASLALVGRSRDEWTFASLAAQLTISTSAAHRVVDSLAYAGLFDASRGLIRSRSLAEFLVHGLKYVCPPQFGPRSRGIATGPFAPPLVSELAASSDESWVWPHRSATSSGPGLDPIHSVVPQVALIDSVLYERFAIVDVLRARRQREVAMAETWLRNELNLRVAA